MTKIELIRGIKEKVSFNITNGDLAEILNAQAEVVAEEIKRDGEVVIPGICKVKTKVVSERTGKVMMGANKGDTWVRPEHKEGCVKALSAIKNIFE